MRGRTFLIALVAVLSLLSATAVAAGHRVVQGTKAADELTAGDGADRVFARGGADTVEGGAGDDRLRGGNGDDELFGGAGDDRLRGGQDNDLLDGGEGDDHLNGGGDGRDKDTIVCGDGHDVVVLGRNDVVVVPVESAEETPGDAADDGCERVKGPGTRQKTCAATRCEPTERPCASSGRDCGGETDDPVGEPCAATDGACDDPVAVDPEPDTPVESPVPGETAKLYR